MKKISIGIIFALGLNLSFADQAQNSSSQQGAIPHNVPAAVKPKPENSPAKSPQKVDGHSVNNADQSSLEQKNK